MRDMAHNGTAVSATTYYGAIDVITQLRQTLHAFFARYDLILTPSIAALSWRAAEPFPVVIDGQAVGPRGHAVFTAFALMFSRAKQLPAGRRPAAKVADTTAKDRSQPRFAPIRTANGRRRIIANYPMVRERFWPWVAGTADIREEAGSGPASSEGAMRPFTASLPELRAAPALALTCGSALLTTAACRSRDSCTRASAIKISGLARIAR